MKYIKIVLRNFGLLFQDLQFEIWISESFIKCIPRIKILIFSIELYRCGNCTVTVVYFWKVNIFITATESTLVCKKSETNLLQTVYNAAARLIFGESRYSRITPLPRDRCHWRRCTERIQYKLCMTVFKTLHGMTPEYLTELCTPVIIGEKHDALRSASTFHELLNIQRQTPDANFGDRAFGVAEHAAWNSLSTNIRIT